MATDSVTVSPTYNGDSVSLTAGMIVRLKPGANNNVVRAQADSAPHAQGVNGVVISGASAPATGCVVVSTGRETVQMESSLTPSVGDTVYVSPNVAGKGTNILPAVVVPIGAIADISAYARLGTVEVDIACGANSSTGGGIVSVYRSATIDFSVLTSGVIQILPTLPGFYAEVIIINLFATAAAGVATGVISLQGGNDAAQQNIIANTSALTVAVQNAVIAAGVPSKLSGLANPSGASAQKLIDMGTPTTLRITVAGVGTGGYALQGYCEIAYTVHPV